MVLSRLHELECLARRHDHHAVVGDHDIARTLIAVTSLSFLGIGPPPPDTDWGGMVSEATPLLVAAPRLAIVPALALALTGLAIALVVDGRSKAGQDTG
ncbi:hypothetical protein ACFLIM_25745 [Nonomuraea sp. M3C6]|uniref:Peptide/nickel transport system permease protein n=1 Tax=Nonomuraea marmarensis TaxID=3351344 RepID=A0ABW7AH38_9ACTN